MYILSLKLRSFRNYSGCELTLGPHTNVLFGGNAQGKTNLLEAMYLCSRAKSYRTSSVSDLVLRGEECAEVELCFFAEGRKQVFRMAVDKKGKKKLLKIIMKKTETKHTCCGGGQNFWLWIGALVVGSCLGLLGVEWVNTAANFVATIFTRLFQFIAVPTIALAVTTTLATFGMQRETRRIFRHTISYTLLTTVAAAAVGMVLYIIISPDNLPIDMVRNSTLGDAVPAEVADGSYLKYMIGSVPDNFLRPFIEGNVLSVLLIAVAVGLALAKMPEGENKQLLMRGLSALQDVVSRLIRWLITVLPVGIVAFAAQLSAEVSAGTVVASIGKYVAVILSGNLLQFFVVLPLFLMARGLNPVHVMRRMMPAVLMALLPRVRQPLSPSRYRHRRSASASTARWRASCYLSAQPST